MYRSLLALVFSAFSFSSFSQTVQWASKVIEFSSELTPLQYSASQALGKPNVLPAGGQNPNAWTPDKPKRSEFLKLGYSTALQIQHGEIAVSNNPGSRFKVYVYDKAGKEYLVSTFKPQAIPIIAQMR